MLPSTKEFTFTFKVILLTISDSGSTIYETFFPSEPFAETIFPPVADCLIFISFPLLVTVTLATSPVVCGV